MENSKRIETLLPEGMQIVTISPEDRAEDQDIFLIEKNGTRMYLRIAKENLTINELKDVISSLKEILIQADSQDQKMSEWFRKHWMNHRDQELEPVRSVKEIDWSQGWIPVILVKQSSHWWDREFVELLHTFFDFDFFEVTLSSTMMMVMVSNKHLQLSTDQTKDAEELAQGLYEMFQNEWGEELKVGVHFPAYHLQDVMTFGNDLLEDVKWVRRLWNHITLFSPWTHRLERFIFMIPDKELAKITMKPWSMENEIYKTLEVFFKENLNMSETARKLFIHRNTLQYRLDKVKQQTGLDVKTFEDATIAKIMLLLQKADY